MHWQKISTEQVVVTCWGESSHSDWADDFCEKMLARWILPTLDVSVMLFELGWDTVVAESDVSSAWREEEDIASFWMELYVGNDLSELFDVRWLQINQLVGQFVVLQAPEVDTQVVTG